TPSPGSTGFAYEGRRGEGTHAPRAQSRDARATAPPRAHKAGHRRRDRAPARASGAVGAVAVLRAVGATRSLHAGASLGCDREPPRDPRAVDARHAAPGERSRFLRL